MKLKLFSPKKFACFSCDRFKLLMFVGGGVVICNGKAFLIFTPLAFQTIGSQVKYSTLSGMLRPQIQINFFPNGMNHHKNSVGT